MSKGKIQSDRGFLSDNAIPNNQVPHDNVLTPELLDLIELLVKIAIDQQPLGNEINPRNLA